MNSPKNKSGADVTLTVQLTPLHRYTVYCIVYTTMNTTMYTAWLGQSDHIVEKPRTVVFVVFVVFVVCNVYRQATDVIIIRMIGDDKTSIGDFVSL